MKKTILLTGATDGIGLETAKMLAAAGHRLLLHGRNREKLNQVRKGLRALSDDADMESYVADLSRMDEVEKLAQEIASRHEKLDVLINNAGVFNAPSPITADGLDVRFAVNTIAPYLLTLRLLPLFNAAGRVVNLSSAAQFPVAIDALTGKIELSDGAAYAQSKLALTMWSRTMALELGDAGPAIIAVNPASMLGSKMVKEAYGVVGGDLRIGADILYRAALSAEFASASGRYFDNDSGRFAAPHSDALNQHRCAEILSAIEIILARILPDRPSNAL
jgi:NAD(P)-dependent dehydrogenase (short-subunit alcohol dehydrogenase family)